MYDKQYKIHQLQASRLLVQLDAVPNLLWALSAIASLIMTLIMVYGKRTTGPAETLPDWSFIAVAPVITYLVRKYIVGYIFTLGLYAIGFLIKKKMWPAGLVGLEVH